MTFTASIDARIASLARRFHNVLQRSQLAAIGVSASVVRRLVRLGWLRRYARGVYIVGSGTLTPPGRARAGALAAGREAIVTAETTLCVTGVIDWEPREVTVLSTSPLGPRDGVRYVRTTSVDEEDRAMFDNVPSTTVERALVEMSPRTNPLKLLKHMRRAKYLHRLDLGRLERTIERLRNRGTCTNIIRAARYLQLGDGGADSELEIRMHGLLRRWGLREPRTNIHVVGLYPNERSDFAWLGERIVVEVDGPHHLDPDVQREDRRRDAALAAGGFTVVRVWWWELDECPGEVRARIAAAFAAA